MEEITRSVRLNTAALEAFKSEQTILNDFVRLNMYNKVFIGVAHNVTVEGKKIIDFTEVKSSANIEIKKSNDMNTLTFANEGYYRLTIQLYFPMKFNPYIQIELFGNSVAKLIDYKKLLSADIGKGTNISNLKTTTITFYTPKKENLTVL